MNTYICMVDVLISCCSASGQGRDERGRRLILPKPRLNTPKPRLNIPKPRLNPPKPHLQSSETERCRASLQFAIENNNHKHNNNNNNNSNNNSNRNNNIL